MITSFTDSKIDKHNKPRRSEKKGRTIGLELKSGLRIIGELIRKEPNMFYVKDFEDDTEKDIHRAIIVRFMVIIEGGKK